ncbi:hypothetical protein PVAP13_7NG003400 [Panicum virgatum]|uniref:MaoC-like domain-containing protein n=1 Tax=Panicum virgatum TaxID=38727 RepID=A0A8T0PRH7_PANVG|nr:hypothetical protein PVAP13_7NG003400 [Panicum virgatum]
MSTQLSLLPTCQSSRSLISDSTAISICAGAMRLGRRAIFPLVRTTTTTTSAASSPPALLSVGHRRRVVHGMLVASLFPSIIAARFPGAVYASQTLKFASPVYVGDEVVARVQALHIRTTTANSTTASRYVVKFATKCFTDEEEGSLAIEGEAMAVLPTLELSSDSTTK